MKLTYDQVQDIIGRGEGIIHDGSVYTRIEDLPQVAQFVTDPAEKADVASRLQSQIDEAQRQLAELNSQPEAEVQTTTEDTSGDAEVGKGDYELLKAKAIAAGFEAKRANPARKQMEDFLAQRSADVRGGEGSDKDAQA